MFLVLPVILCGCLNEGGTDNALSQVCPAFGFVPAAIEVNRLSEITLIDDYNEYAVINVFVDVADMFGVNMKAPGVLRFELYEYKNLSANNIGTRIYDWPVIDITNGQENQKYWRDSLRAYMFELKIGQKLDKNAKYVLSATFINETDRLRFTDTRIVEYYGK